MLRPKTNYGQMLCRHGQFEQAEQRFLQALKNTLYGTPEVAYSNAGVCSKTAGHPERAEGYFRAALKRNPRQPTALVHMAQISFEASRHLSARAYLQRYLETSRHTSKTLWLGIRIERVLGDKNAASSYAMLLRSQYPDSTEARLLESNK